MTGTLQDYAAAVTNVIAICRDAEQGFRGAADAVKDPMLKELFEGYSEQRGRFAGELQTAVKALGFDPTHPTGVGGTVHAAWMTLKGVLTGHKPNAILAETERGEDMSIKTYREALALNLPVELHALIQRQFEEVQAAHSRIRTLRDASAPQEPSTPAPPTSQTPVSG